MRASLIVVLTALLAAVAFAAGCTKSTSNEYGNANLPSSCPDVEACLNARAACITSTCTAQQTCLHNFTVCINAAAANAANASAADTCSKWGASITSQLNAFATGKSPNWAATNIYKACTASACALANASCAIGYSYICPRPADAPTATPTPLKPITKPPVGVPTTTITTTSSFAGDFSALFLNETAKDEFCATVSLQLAIQMGLSEGSYSQDCTQGSLIVAMNIVVPTSDTAAINAIQANADNLNDNTDTTWLTNLNSQLASVCSSCSSLSTPIVASASAPNTPAPYTPSIEAKCGSGCIAGVIVAVTVVVIIVVTLVVVLSKKIGASAAGTGQKTLANEPAAGSSEPTAV